MKIKEIIRTTNGKRRRARTTRRRNRAQRSTTTTTNTILSTSGPPTQRTNFRKRLSRRSRNITRLSEPGLAFLKCAFASPDFSVDPGKGIPDSYNGRTLSIKDCFTTTESFPEGKDTYIIVAPVPGYAYFKATVNNGANPSGFTGVTFPTYATNFGFAAPTAVEREKTTNNNYAAFRYASLAAGVYPTSNYMSFSGSISVWKADLELGEVDGLAVRSVSITGVPPSVKTETGTFLKKRLFGAGSMSPLVPRDNYTESFIRGSYAMAADKTGKFEWNDFCYAEQYRNTEDNDTADLRYLQEETAATDMTSKPLTGLGNTETIIIKISSPPGSKNSAVLKLWNCIELKPRTDSSLYQFSGVSPPHDPLALEMYNHVKNNLPVAVCASENAWSWERVLKIMNQVGSSLAMVPGPIGLIGTGVGALSSGLQNLFF